MARSSILRRLDESDRISNWMSKKRIVMCLAIGAVGSGAVVWALFTLGGGQTRRVPVKAEVISVFTELQIRQAQAQLEGGSFRSSSAINSEGDLWPTARVTDGTKMDLLPLPSEWTDLKMEPDISAVFCSYVVVVGNSGDDANIGPIASQTFGYTAPEKDWFYLLARCDMDGDPSIDSYYFQSSEHSSLFWVNRGH